MFICEFKFSFLPNSFLTMQQVNSARWLQEGIINLGVALSWNVARVRRVFREYKVEVHKMANYGAIYYAPWMLLAKYAAK